MKKTIIIPLFTFTLIIHISASAALPQRWDVELAAQTPQVFTLQRPRGETYELEAVLKNHGKPFEPAITNACIYWQTNGMANLYWSAPASVSNNVLRATWLPSMDPGATTVRGYIGDPGHIYAAAFQFRFIASPGATPNELPLPQKVIDFAKVTVLNPPWSGGGGGGGVDTNAVVDIIHRTVDGSARTTPKYLWIYDCADSYPEAAHEYYSSRGNGKTDGGCSSVRDGGFLYRNFDYPFDDRAEFVVHMSSGPARFASVGVAQVGTNLTEQIVTSGKPSRWYKALPGATVDGINENGVACNINVVGGDPQTSGWHTTGDLHPLGAIRHILDHATNAQHGAEYIAANIRFPQGWAQNFHYMVADATSTYIVENGSAHAITNGVPAITNFRLYPTPSDGEGQERYIALTNGANITSQWWTLTYTPAGYRASDLHGITGEDLANLFNYWENNPREAHRGERFGDKVWWQTVHTSVYDITNRILRVSVQETDDWYIFAVDQANVDLAPIAAQLAALQSDKRDKTDLKVYRTSGNFGILRFDGSGIHDEDGVYEWNAERNRWEFFYEEDHLNYIVVSLTNCIYSAKMYWYAIDGEEGDLEGEWTGTEIGDQIQIDNEYGDKSVFNVARYKLATDGGVASAIAAHHDSTKLDARTIHWDSNGDLVIGGDSVYPNLRMYTGSIEEVGSISLERPDGVSYLSPIDGRIVWVDLSKIAAKRDLTNMAVVQTTGNFGILGFQGDGYDTDLWRWDESSQTWNYGEDKDLYYIFGEYVNGVHIFTCHYSDKGNFVWTGCAKTKVGTIYGRDLFFEPIFSDNLAKESQIPPEYVPSPTDPVFSNAVDQIVRSLIPTTLRAYDPVRKCWWNIQPVNGVLTLTVED